MSEFATEEPKRCPECGQWIDDCVCTVDAKGITPPPQDTPLVGPGKEQEA